MPEMMLAEPAQKQQPVHTVAFDPQHVRIEAMTSVTHLIEKCKAEIRENQNQQGAISSFSLMIKPEHRQETLDIYNKAVQDTNDRLTTEGAPFRLKGEMKGDSFYFVAGYRDQKRVEAPDLTLSEKNFSILFGLVNEKMDGQSEVEKRHSRIQRLGDTIICVVQGLVDRKDDVPRILTPQELVTAMIDYKEGRRTAMPEANCTDISLLTNELLRLSGYDTSIITLHAINKYGEEEDGHTTAAVVADGWLIDPALQTRARQIGKITFDKKDKNYQNFSKSMEDLYLKALGQSNPRGEPPLKFEFHVDKNENELKAMYLMENGVKLCKQGNDVEGIKYLQEASRLNPKNFYADYQTASRISESNPDEARKLLVQGADQNPDLYLANYYAGAGLFDISRKDATIDEPKPYSAAAYGYAKKAAAILESEGNSFYFGYLTLNVIENYLHVDAAESYQKMAKCPQPPVNKLEK